MGQYVSEVLKLKNQLSVEGQLDYKTLRIINCLESLEDRIVELERKGK